MAPNLLAIAGSDPSGGGRHPGGSQNIRRPALLRHGGDHRFDRTEYARRFCPATRRRRTSIAAQIDAIFADIDVAAVKIGMLASAAIVEVVADRLAVHKPQFIVLDPVLIAT